MAQKSSVSKRTCKHREGYVSFDGMCSADISISINIALFLVLDVFIHSEGG